MSQALVLEAKTSHTNGLLTSARIFHTNVERLGKAQAACDRWLTDPDKPEEYWIGARSEEVTVKYEDPRDLNEHGRPKAKKAKLAVLLRESEVLNGLTVTGFETKFSDPRRLLTDYSNSLRGELTLFMQAWNQWQVDEKERLEAEERRASEGDAVQALFTAALGEVLPDLLRESLIEAGVKPNGAASAAEATAPYLLAKIVARFGEDAG